MVYLAVGMDGTAGQGCLVSLEGASPGVTFAPGAPSASYKATWLP